jgi:hypothetical protein
MFFRKCFLNLLLLLAGTGLTGGAGFAADAVSLNFQNKDGTYDVNASFQVAADCPVVWDVLTDYDRLPKFVGSLKRSHIEEYLGRSHFLLEQEFEGGFLFVTKRVRVRLDVRETRCELIRFEDVGHQDFEFYKGSWKLVSDANGELTVNYTLKAQQNFDEPFAGDYMKGGIKDLLDSVRREIIRRQAIRGPSASLSKRASLVSL